MNTFRISFIILSHIIYSFFGKHKLFPLSYFYVTFDAFKLKHVTLKHNNTMSYQLAEEQGHNQHFLSANIYFVFTLPQTCPLDVVIPTPSKQSSEV